jgi:hypothetical protein
MRHRGTTIARRHAMKTLRSLTCVVAALGAIAIAACSSDSSASGSLHVQNNSDFAIVQIHVAPVGTTNWGRNLIAGDTLDPGDSLTVDVTCGTYDALLVDEQGVDCQLQGVDLCLNSADWVIRNETCTVFGAARAAREAAKAAGSGSAPSTPVVPDAK